MLVGLGSGAVIAGENHHQEFGVGEVRERVSLAVNAGEFKIGCRCADLECFRLERVCHWLAEDKEEQEDQPESLERVSIHR